MSSCPLVSLLLPRVLAGVREPIPVKKLLLVAEMSLDASGRIDGARLATTLQEAGIL